MTTPPTTPSTAPTTVPGGGELSRKAYVAGIERIWSALLCIMRSKEEPGKPGEEEGDVAGSGTGSSFVTRVEVEREMNAEDRSRMKRSNGSAKVDIGAIVGD